jgi:trimethylguanosine synthase
MEPYSLKFMYQEYSVLSKHIVLYLPRTSDLKQLAKIVDDGKKIHVKHYCIEGSSKALCAYYGDFNASALD